jgi:hypothetical protein
LKPSNASKDAQSCQDMKSGKPVMSNDAKVNLREVLLETWAQFSDELTDTPLPHFSESVFRFMFVRTLLRRYQEVRCETEWNRIDLMFIDSQGPSVIEFKFYVHNRHRDLQGVCRHWKGGAGDRNFREFCKCIKDLVDLDHASWGRDSGKAIKNRYLILAYTNTHEHQGEKSYRHWYDRLELPEPIKAQANVKRLVRLKDTVCAATKHKMRCSLFGIQPK